MRDIASRIDSQLTRRPALKGLKAHSRWRPGPGHAGAWRLYIVVASTSSPSSDPSPAIEAAPEAPCAGAVIQRNADLPQTRPTLLRSLLKANLISDEVCASRSLCAGSYTLNWIATKKSEREGARKWRRVRCVTSSCRALGPATGPRHIATAFAFAAATREIS